MIHPINGQVLIKPVITEVSQGGIVLPAGASTDTYALAVVVEVASDVKKDNKQLYEDLIASDSILVDAYQVRNEHLFDMNGARATFVLATEVVAVLDNVD